MRSTEEKKISVVRGVARNLIGDILFALTKQFTKAQIRADVCVSNVNLFLQKFAICFAEKSFE